MVQRSMSGFVRSGTILALLWLASCSSGVNSSEIPIPEQFRNGTSGIELLPVLPSSLPLQDYESQLYNFLKSRKYAQPSYRWAFDRRVRDTGPFILSANYGTHGVVRIYYSPGVLNWLANGRSGDIPDGAMIIKEQFTPEKYKGSNTNVPAAFYNELKTQLTAQYPDNPMAVDTLFEAILGAYLESWVVMVKDKSVSNGGWFWANPGRTSDPDNPVMVATFPNSGPAQGTCQRCHSSAAVESTFASLTNITGFEAQGEPLQFRVDNHWRQNLPPPPFSSHSVVTVPAGLNLPEPPQLVNMSLSPYELPAGGESEQDLISDVFEHNPAAADPAPLQLTVKPRTAPSHEWTDFFPALQSNRSALPGQWADHVAAAPGGAEHFITSDNCVGCHGGLGGAPSGVTMFLQTGASYGAGYNLSEFGEWRWSPMGLAGRDPIFYAQLESEFALLAQGAAKEAVPQQSSSQLRTIQQAVANTCLSCHGAMGQRQLAIDVKQNVSPEVTDPNFYLDYIHLSNPLTTRQEKDQKNQMIQGLDGPHSAYPYRKYGNLAREGISCMVCHHIDPPRQWHDGMTANDRLATFLMNSTTGVFPYSPRDELNGPFSDMRIKPMENFLGVTPVQAPLVDPPFAAPATGKIPYIKDSKLCGTCHVINLPNVDAARDKPLPGLDPEQQEILNQAGRNGANSDTNEFPVPLSEHLTEYQYSIEQGTYLEWDNSAFAWDPVQFRSCQDCHMPGGFENLDGTVKVEQLKTQIATIQDSNYPDADHSLTHSQLDVPVRSDYSRHELVGLNAFLLEIFNQFDSTKSSGATGTQVFDSVLRVSRHDPETFATNGDRLAQENMQISARDKTVSLDVTPVLESGSLTVTVDITSQVGHKFPSGVGFRRAFLEVALLRQGETRPVWVSGATNSIGVIIDGNGDPLPTERLPDAKTYQPHHETITRQDQVQIYEELTLNASKEFTTSFIHRDSHPKDNRLLPSGYLDPGSSEFQSRFKGPGTTDKAFAQIQAFMQATKPEGKAAGDGNFKPGSDRVNYEIPLPPNWRQDSLSVRATMYYQAIPPFWLLQRFSQAPEGPATRRLYHLTSLLNTAEGAVKDWKLKMVSETIPIE